MAAPREIVVGYDGSERAGDALRHVCELADERTHITVVTVYRMPPEVRSYEFFEDLRGAFRESAEEVIGSARKLVPAGRSNVDYVVTEGVPAEALIECARQRGADLIAVGASGTGRLRAAIGSVTNRLLHDSPYPVLVAPGGHRPRS